MNFRMLSSCFMVELECCQLFKLKKYNFLEFAELQKILVEGPYT